jgi:UrcA family protein
VNTFIKLIPAVALAALFLSPAQAGNEPSSRHTDGTKMTVRFGDLNLSKPHDAEILYHRIRIAAVVVCRAEVESSDVARNRNWIKCLNGATDEAVRRVNRPTLTALHQECERWSGTA